MSVDQIRLGLFPDDVRRQPPAPPVPLGTGWAFPVGLQPLPTPPLAKGGTGVFGVSTVSEVEHLIQSVKLILMTERGTRVRRPWFGSELWKWLDSPINARTLAEMRLAVVEALDEEPRAKVRQILVENPEPAHLVMTIILQTDRGVTVAVVIQYDRDRKRWRERGW